MSTRPPTPTRDDPAYWDDRPEDHSGDGLYRDGPHLRGNPLAALIVSSEAPAVVPSPQEARGRQACAEAVARRQLAKRGTHGAPTPRTRKGLGAAGQPRVGYAALLHAIRRA